MGLRFRLEVSPEEPCNTNLDLLGIHGPLRGVFARNIGPRAQMNRHISGGHLVVHCLEQYFARWSCRRQSNVVAFFNFESPLWLGMGRRGFEHLKGLVEFGLVNFVRICFFANTFQGLWDGCRL